MGIQINGQTGTVTSTTAGGSVTVTPLAASGGLNVGTGASISSPATNVLTLGTNNTEKVRILSSGSVGIGTDIPGSYDSGGRTLVISENSTLAGMTIRSSSQGAIYFSDGLTGNEAYRGRIEYSHSSDSLNFGTAGTGSRVNIDSSGRLGVGIVPKTWTSGYNVLQVGSASLVGQSEQDGQTTNWSNNAYFDTNDNRWEYGFADQASQITQSDGLIIFKTASTGTANAALSWTESARFNTSGNLAFPSGQGIDFSATANSSGTMTSELLSDYEEGTWTPAISGSSSGTVTSGTIVGTYTKVGRIVTARFTFTNPNATTIGGTWRLTGLPFAIRQSSNEYIGGFVHYNRTINTAGNWLGLFQEASNSQTYFRVMAHYMNGTESYDISGNVSSSLLFAGTVFYEAA